MKTMEIKINNDIILDFQVVSIIAYNRRKPIIYDMLQRYIYEFNSPQVIAEIKRNIQFILDSDVTNIRLEKLKNIVNYGITTFFKYEI